MRYWEAKGIAPHAPGNEINTHSLRGIIVTWIPVGIRDPLYTWRAEEITLKRSSYLLQANSTSTKSLEPSPRLLLILGSFCASRSTAHRLQLHGIFYNTSIPMRNASSASFQQQTMVHIQPMCIWWISLRTGETRSQEGGLTPFHTEFKPLIASFCLLLPWFATINNLKNVWELKNILLVMLAASANLSSRDSEHRRAFKFSPCPYENFVLFFNNKDSSLSKRSLVPATKIMLPYSFYY